MESSPPYGYSQLESTFSLKSEGMVLYDDGSGDVIEYDLVTNDSTLVMEGEMEQFLGKKIEALPATQPARSVNQSPVDYAKANSAVHSSDTMSTSRKRTDRFMSDVSYTAIPDRYVPPRARATLPTVLRLAGDRVLTRRRLPPHTLFGPVQGVLHEVSAGEAAKLKEEAAAASQVVFLMEDQAGCETIHIDVSDENASNWLRYVPLATSPVAANLRLRRSGQQLWAVAEQALPPNTPLAFAHDTDSADGSAASGAVEGAAAEEWTSSHDPLEDAAAGRRGRPRGRRRLLRCQHCPRVFARTLFLKRHMLTHTRAAVEPEADGCERAGGGGVSRAAGGGGGERLVCALCGERAASRRQHRAHTETHRAHDNCFHCAHCPKQRESYAAIQKHTTAQHGGAARYVCPNCGLSFAHSSAYTSHMLKYSDERQYICECGTEFKRKDKLTAHIKKKHPSGIIEKKRPAVTNDIESMLYACRQCHIGFKRRGMLVNHIARRHPDRPAGAVAELALPVLRPRRDYYCTRCARVYTSAAKRMRHFLRHHPGEPAPASRHEYTCERPPAPAAPHPCPACRRQYASRGRLNRHLRETHPHLAPSLKRPPPRPPAPPPPDDNSAPAVLFLADLAAEQSALMCPKDGDAVSLALEAAPGAGLEVPGVELEMPGAGLELTAAGLELSGAETYAAEALTYLQLPPREYPHAHYTFDLT